MIQAYVKIFDSKNRDYIYENPQKDEFVISMGGNNDIKALRMLDDAIIYRQAFLANEAINKLTQELNEPIVCNELFYYLTGYLNRFDSQGWELIHNLSLESVKEAKILIYLDFCLDKDVEGFKELQDEFIKENPIEHIFSYKALESKYDPREKARLIKLVKKIKDEQALERAKREQEREAKKEAQNEINNQ